MNTTQRFSVRSPRDLARTITEARLLRNLTQGELAAATGIDRTYISRLENGLDSTQLERAFRIFRELGVQIDARIDVDTDE